MNPATEVVTPKRHFFGDVLLIQVFFPVTGDGEHKIHVPAGSEMRDERIRLFVAAKGDGPKVSEQDIKVGDEVYLLHELAPNRDIGKAVVIDGVKYILMGYDNIESREPRADE